MPIPLRFELVEPSVGTFVSEDPNFQLVGDLLFGLSSLTDIDDLLQYIQEVQEGTIPTPQPDGYSGGDTCTAAFFEGEVVRLIDFCVGSRFPNLDVEGRVSLADFLEAVSLYRAFIVERENNRNRPPR